MSRCGRTTASRIAFSSDRGNPLGSDYNIWVLELASGALRQLTTNPAEDSMPSWSPNDADIAFVSTRDGERHVWAVPAQGGAERQVATSAGRVDAASWGPGGQIVLHALEGRSSRLELGGASITGTENAFPFRPSWVSATEFFYTADGKIRRRAVGASSFTDVPFTAMLQATPARYTRVARNFDSRTPRKVLGVVRPVLSPDGTKVAFAAVGDIWVMPVGGAAENLTKDRFLDTDPAWSPDGRRLVYSSDKGGQLLQLWIRDLATGQDRQLTRLTTQPQGAAWSPDGTRIAFFDVDGMWRRAPVSVVDVASRRGHAHSRVAVLARQSDLVPGRRTRGRGHGGVLLDAVPRGHQPGTDDVVEGRRRQVVRAAIPTCRSIRAAAAVRSGRPTAPRWPRFTRGCSRCGRSRAAGEPLGPPRRVTSEMAHSPSWAGDSKRLLYQSMDKLRIVDIETGQVTDVPLTLTYTPAVPTARTTIHVSRLVDGVSETARGETDIVVEGNRIRSVAPHSAAAHRGAVIDGTGLTAMPGLIEFHSHLQKDFGEAQGRAWLAFGVTTVRSPGNTPYEAVEDREANEAAIRPGPRVYGTGYLMEWQRVYYKMGVAISSPAHLEMELERAKVLQHDLIKSYVRLPDLQQKRMMEFAHGIGVPVATHEIFPAALVGVDNTEHTAATSRRGYSPKQTTLQRAYADVVQLFGKSERLLVPDDVGRRCAAHLRRRTGAAAGSPLRALPGVDRSSRCATRKPAARPAADSTALATTRC